MGTIMNAGMNFQKVGEFLELASDCWLIEDPVL
jgi:hypothetical protein